MNTCLLETTVDKIQTFIKGKGLVYKLVPNGVVVRFGYSFTDQQVFKIAEQNIKLVNEKFNPNPELFGDIVSLNTSITDGVQINIHPTEKYIDALEVRNEERTFDNFSKKYAKSAATGDYISNEISLKEQDIRESKDFIENEESLKKITKASIEANRTKELEKTATDIFPNSEVKQILLHGTPKYTKTNAYKLLELSEKLSDREITEEEFNNQSKALKTKIEKFDKNKIGLNSNISSKEGFFFTDNKEVALYSKSNDLYSVVINSENPLIKNENGKKINLKELDNLINNRNNVEPEFLYPKDQDIWEEEIKNGRILDTQEPIEELSKLNKPVFKNQKYKKSNKSFDSIILNNVIDSLEEEQNKLGTTYVVFEPEQIHILTQEEFNKIDEINAKYDKLIAELENKDKPNTEINNAIGIQLELFENKAAQLGINNGDIKTTNCK